MITWQKPLVDRLLDSADYHDNGGVAELQMSDEGALLREAADEIKRLRAALLKEVMTPEPLYRIYRKKPG